MENSSDVNEKSEEKQGRKSQKSYFLMGLFLGKVKKLFFISPSCPLASKRELKKRTYPSEKVAKRKEGFYKREFFDYLTEKERKV